MSKGTPVESNCSCIGTRAKAGSGPSPCAGPSPCPGDGGPGEGGGVCSITEPAIVMVIREEEKAVKEGWR